MPLESTWGIPSQSSSWHPKGSPVPKAPNRTPPSRCRRPCRVASWHTSLLEVAELKAWQHTKNKHQFSCRNVTRQGHCWLIMNHEVREKNRHGMLRMTCAKYIHGEMPMLGGGKHLPKTSTLNHSRLVWPSSTHWWPHWFTKNNAMILQDMPRCKVSPCALHTWCAPVHGASGKGIFRITSTILSDDFWMFNVS